MRMPRYVRTGCLNLLFSRRRWFQLASIAFVASTFLALGALTTEILSRRYLRGCWGFFGPDPVLGWSFRPGYCADALVAVGDGKIRKFPVRINSSGLHDREIPYEKPPATRRILCLGDSFVEAFQVPLEEMFTKRLERSLNESVSSGSLRYEVVSAGNGNYGTDQELLFYEKEGRKYRPDIVVLFFFPLNDFSDNAADLNDRAYFAKTFFELDDKGRLQRSAQPLLPPLVERLRRGNRWTRLAGRSRAFNLAAFYLHSYAPSAANAMEDMGLIPLALTKTSEGYYLLWDIHRRPLDRAWQRAIDVTGALVAELKRQVEADGARFRTVTIPGAEVLTECFPEQTRRLWPHLQRADMDPAQAERLAREMLTKTGAPMLDLAPAFVRAIRETGKPVNLMPDGHFNAFGHETVARALRQFLLDLGDLPRNTSDATDGVTEPVSRSWNSSLRSGRVD